MKRGILLIALLLAGCTTPAPQPLSPAAAEAPAAGAPPPAGAPPAPAIDMGRHRLILPDGDWTVLIRDADPAAGTVTFVVIGLSGPPDFRIVRDDPAVRTMTVGPPRSATVRPSAGTAPAGPAARIRPGPYLLTARRGRIIAVHEIARV